MEFNDYEADVWCDLEAAEELGEPAWEVREPELSEHQRIGLSMLALRGYVRINRTPSDWSIALTDQGRLLVGYTQRDECLSYRPGEGIYCKRCAGKE